MLVLGYSLLSYAVQRHSWVLPKWQLSRTVACALLPDSDPGIFPSAAIALLGVCSDPIISIQLKGNSLPA